jgi:hypothetical protein
MIVLVTLRIGLKKYGSSINFNASNFNTPSVLFFLLIRGCID